MAILTYRALSFLCFAGVVAFCLWLFLTPTGYSSLIVIVAVIASLTLCLLYWGSSGEGPLWTAAEVPAQVPRVLIVVLACLGFQLGAGAGVLSLELPINLLTLTALTLTTWVGIPAVALITGFVRWPHRTRTPSRRDLLIVSSVALLIGAAVFFLRMVPLQDTVPQRLPGGLLADTTVTFVAAAAEEVVFRVLLLTALLSATGSRLQALVLSSTFFAIVHVPLDLAGPLLALEWQVMADGIVALAPSLLMKLGVGFLLGAVWLRTGSLILISLLHFMGNFGPVLAAGYLILGA